MIDRRSLVTLAVAAPIVCTASPALAARMGTWDLSDLDNPPDISGVWECVSREMFERNPGDGKLKGVVTVDPPDPRAPGGRIVMKIEQSGGNYTSSDLVNATHGHVTKGWYIGDKKFAYHTVREADEAHTQMSLNGVATLREDGMLETMVVGAKGGNLAPDVRDPPDNYRERRVWRRVPAPTGAGE